MGAVSIVISLIAVAISATTLWLTYLRRGRLAMTKPTLVFFGHDPVPRTPEKIFLRTLLYSTATQGQMIEGMYVKLRREDSEQTFSFWAYGESEKLVAGGGLHVGRAGFSANHHFVLSVHCPSYEFLPGDYTIDVYAHVVGKKSASKLKQINLTLTDEHATALTRREGIFFEWEPDTQVYVGHQKNPRETPYTANAVPMSD
ncbi:MAG: hypothetical protein GC131_04435 [Alphaproteobacteria bacterium]|nr:hypothetical protein [Alphaproteobacteria bacterium]